MLTPHLPPPHEMGAQAVMITVLRNTDGWESLPLPNRPGGGGRGRARESVVDLDRGYGLTSEN